jgi:hypothetical protein
VQIPSSVLYQCLSSISELLAITLLGKMAIRKVSYLIPNALLNDAFQSDGIKNSSQCVKCIFYTVPKYASS